MAEVTYSFGPNVENGRFIISAFAPEKKQLELYVDGDILQMESSGNGFWKASIDLDRAGSRYGFIIDGNGPFPDPGGRFMPDGIDGMSQLLKPGKFGWKNTGWKGLPLEEYLIEEIHVGTFTEEGTFASTEGKLDYLSDLGVTAVEIMPVAQFYGTRNWGYDGVYLYSPQHSYGKPEELMHLVDEIHSRGMCAILDVVYNHSGPVGNYLDSFAPFHHLEHKTTWGSSFNLDGEYSGQIREYILQNAIYWLREFRFDALRLDAVHGIVDLSPKHILEEMAQRVNDLKRETGRRILLMAESDLNDVRLTKEIGNCGKGMDAQWNDDFHHALHTVFTGEHKGYYMDYGKKEDIPRVMNGGFLFQGQYSPYLKRKRGTPWDNPPQKLVVCSQNHDQIGNRAMGRRLISLAGPEKTKLAAVLTILSPFTPLLFMGEEFGADSPFLYFIQTDDLNFAETVRKGRLKEFKRFDWRKGTPDPSKYETYRKSKIRWERSGEKISEEILDLYRTLINLRKQFVLKNRIKLACNLNEEKVLQMRYGDDLLVLGSLDSSVKNVHIPDGKWQTALDTSWDIYGGRGTTESISNGICRLEPFAGAVLISREVVFP